MTVGTLIALAVVVLLSRPWRSENPAVRDYSALLEACVVTLVLIALLAQT